MTESKFSLHTLDYVLVVLSLIVTMIIGIYHGYVNRKKKFKVVEYLMGDRNFGVLPLAMSSTASLTSNITFSGLPGEIYTYGTIFSWNLIGNFIATLFISFMFMPVFYRLKVTSVYEYVGMRFNPSVRALMSVIYVIGVVLSSSVYTYSASLIISQITGYETNVLSAIFTLICIFYTTLGGMKTVVYTDSIQFSVMMICGITIVVIGTHDVGGFSQVLSKGLESERIEFFDFRVDPTIRHTTWSVLLGSISHGLLHGFDQAILQRCLSLPSEKQAKIMLITTAILCAALGYLFQFMGLVFYAAYYDCDPITTCAVKKSDQLMIHFLANLKTTIPLLPGLFTAGILSASLSTISTKLNSVSAVILQDIFRPIWFKIFRKSFDKEKYALLVLQTSVVITGVICILLSAGCETFNNLVQASWIVNAVTGTALLGIFLLGMLYPRGSSRGALIGGLSSLAISSWLSIGAQRAVAAGKIANPMKMISTDGCVDLQSLNSTCRKLHSLNATSEGEEVFYLYRLSYLHVITIGALLPIVIGIFASNIFSQPGTNNVDLLSPQVRRLIKEDQSKKNNAPQSIPLIQLSPQVEIIHTNPSIDSKSIS